MTSVQTLLKLEYSPTFQDAVFFFVAATTKQSIPYGDEIRRLLTRVFETTHRLRLPSLSQEERPIVPDLSRSFLHRIAVAGLYLGEADLAFAPPRRANLKGIGLRRVRGIEVNLEGARLGQART